MIKRNTSFFVLAALVALASLGTALGADWPMWRYDSNHTATSPEQLDTTQLQLHWKRNMGVPQPAWDKQQEVDCYGGPGQPIYQKLSFDIAYQPVVMGDTMYVSSMNTDSVSALSLYDGREKWRFYANGPVRFAPVAMNGKIYFGSDDGYLYCLNTKGNLVWKVAGGPSNRKILGNDRVMSVWPVRGAPVLPIQRDSVPNPAYLTWLENKAKSGSKLFMMTAGTDDSEERLDGSIDLASSDLELGMESLGANDFQIIGLRLSNPFYTIPQNGTVTTATLQFRVDETKGGALPLVVRVYGEKSGASASFTTNPLDISSRVKTTAFVDWDMAFWPKADATGPEGVSPNLAAIVNEIVASPDWVAGSPITFIIERLAGDGIRCAESFEGDGKGATLSISADSLIDSVHTRPVMTTDINPAYEVWLNAVNSPEAKNFTIATGIDDVEEEVSNGALYVDSSDLEFMNDGSTKQVIGLRFTNSCYYFAAGGTVAKANIQFRVDELKGGTDPLKVKITGDISGYSPTSEAGDSKAFSGSYNVSNRARTTAQVIWDIPSWTNQNEAGPAQLTPDLSAIVNEIIALPGYHSGSAITFIIEHVEGNGVRCADANEDGWAPRLIMETGSLVMDMSGAPDQYITDTVTDTVTIYFAAGSYPFEGSFVHAVDMNTGKIKWTNDSAYMYFTVNPHSTAEGYNGLAPQGYLCTGQNGKLLVPNGRGLPGCFDRETGKFLFMNVGSIDGAAKGDGGYFVSSMGDFFYANAQRQSKSFCLLTGKKLGNGNPLMDENNLMITAGDTEFTAGQIFGYMNNNFDFTVRGGQFAHTLDARPAGLVAANGYLIASDTAGNIYCFGQGKPAYRVKNYPAPAANIALNSAAKVMADSIVQSANYRNGMRGNCVVVGLTTGKLIEALALTTDLNIIAFEPNVSKANSIRKALDKAGLYGRKIHIITEEFVNADFPSHTAHIVTSEQVIPAIQSFANVYPFQGSYIKAWLAYADFSAHFAREAFRVVRPYGGCIVMGMDYGMTAGALQDQSNARISLTNSAVRVEKHGKLPGAGDWTHQHCNVQQTTLSEDELVKLPLGVLWFGGSDDNTNDKILPRHGHGPSPQVVGGRYFIQGRDTLRCVDVYTGRTLWEKEILNVGQFSDYTGHEAGQLALGDNYISTEDAVYVLGPHVDNDWPLECIVLDPATGVEMKRFSLPNLEGFGALMVYEDKLIVTANPMLQDLRGYNNAGVAYPEGSGWIYQNSDPMVGVGGLGTYNGSTSEKIYVLDRNSCQILWETTAQHGFFHNSIVAGNGKLFTMDRINWDPAKPIEDRYKSKSAASDASFKPAVLTAFNVADGSILWRKTQDDAPLFGSWLAYVEEHDILLEAQRHSRDYWEPHKGSKHMAAWRGATGESVWSKINRAYLGGPLIIRGTMVITQSGDDMGAVELLTGEPFKVASGVTGEMADFAGFKRYGCGTGIASTNVMLFRSGNAGYYDLNTNSGTGNWGGFKTGCTINLMPANGLIVAPEYTRTCGCSYQFQTSVALIHRPDVEQWSCNKNLGSQYKAQGGRMMNVGLNFGAIGDRVDADGKLWIEYPFLEPAGGFNYQIPVDITVNGEEVKYFRHHSLTIKQGDLKWVASSGVEGASSIVVDMVRDQFDAEGNLIVSPARDYEVCLYFAESDETVKPGDRVFNVSVNGVSVGSVDVAAEVGVKSVLVKKLDRVNIGEEMLIELGAASGKTLLCGVGVKPVE